MELKELLHERTNIDVVIILLYLLGVIFISNNYLKFGKKQFNLVLCIGIIHMLFTFLYYSITLSSAADAIGYYRRVYFVFNSWPETLGDSLGQGANFIYFVLYPFVNFFELTYFGCFFIFSFVGFIGFKLLFDVVLNLCNYRWTYKYIYFLLPNLHFWTVGIGKDSLYFFALCAFVYAYYFNKPFRNYIIPFIIIGFIRIHILVFIGVGYLLANTLQNKSKSSGYKVFVVLFFAIASLVVFPILKDRLGVDDTSTVDEKIERMQNANMNGDSGVDLSNSILIIKWLAYMYRPLFYDAKNILSLLASFENALYVYISYQSIKMIRFLKKLTEIKFFFWFCFFIMLTISIPSAYLISNLGIAMRQKTMAFPFFLCLYFYLLSTKEKLLLEFYQKQQLSNISSKKYTSLQQKT